MKPEIHWVCCHCGWAASTLTCIAKRGQLPNQVAYDVSTFHDGICDCCGGTKSVTEARDFYYPDFSLLSVQFKNRVKDLK